MAINDSEIQTAESEIAQAQAAVGQAELELSHTKIYAPQDGFVSKKTVVEGQLVQPDQVLMSISLPGIWVVANFKETQIERMKVGQPVEIYVDAYPNMTFRGRVESFQAGTGSRFSVLPPENATGNFVKVVQRIPVKIVFEEMPDENILLAPGMSVVPKVRVQ
jgi:membrane fusion protein, multidrug efflux system